MVSDYKDSHPGPQIVQRVWGGMPTYVYTFLSGGGRVGSKPQVQASAAVLSSSLL